jgi:hypothetical protein
MIISNNAKKSKYMVQYLLFFLNGLELLQESDIWILKISEIRNTILYHHETI